jgi:hypothetical protein
MKFKKVIKSLLILALILGTGAVYILYYPVDIRTEYLKKGIQEADYEKGKALIKLMEQAHGGKEEWLSYKNGVFIQLADWYGRLGVSNWDVVPQRFELTCELGGSDSELLLINGPNKGTKWGVENGESYKLSSTQTKEFISKNHYTDKLLYKSYWFQFPFRIGEAEFISYAGEAVINHVAYDLVYVTWGSEKPNSTYDQYIVYLNKETHLLEWLHFTVREKVAGMAMSAHFDNFKYVDKIILPHDQYVTRGAPGTDGFKFHENHYEVIRLGSNSISK